MSLRKRTVKMQHGTKRRGRYCGDIELIVYLPNVTVPVSLVLDLHIVHDRFGRNFDLNLNGHLHYPDDIDRSLNETVTDKIRKYRSDCNNNPPNTTSFMPVIGSTSGRLYSGVQLPHSTSGLFHFHRAPFYAQLKVRGSTFLPRLQIYDLT